MHRRASYGETVSTRDIVRQARTYLVPRVFERRQRERRLPDFRLPREEMSDLCHKYLCVFCKCFIFGATPVRLAANLNDHNNDKHPMESHDWTGSGIMYSTHYSGPSTPNVNWTAA